MTAANSLLSWASASFKGNEPAWAGDDVAGLVTEGRLLNPALSLKLVCLSRGTNCHECCQAFNTQLFVFFRVEAPEDSGSVHQTNCGRLTSYSPSKRM